MLQRVTYIPLRLTQYDPAVVPLHFEQPGLGGPGPVVDELLQALPGHLQRVLVGEPADGLDDYGGSGVGAAHGEGLLPDQLEHPVLSDDFLFVETCFLRSLKEPPTQTVNRCFNSPL